MNLGAKMYHTLQVSSSLNDVGAVQTFLYMHRYSKFIVAMPTPVVSKAIKLCTVSIVSYLRSFNKETMRPLAVLWSTVYLPSLDKNIGFTAVANSQNDDSLHPWITCIPLCAVLKQLLLCFSLILTSSRSIHRSFSSSDHLFFFSPSPAESNQAIRP